MVRGHVWRVSLPLTLAAGVAASLAAGGCAAEDGAMDTEGAGDMGGDGDGDGDMGGDGDGDGDGDMGGDGDGDGDGATGAGCGIAKTPGDRMFTIEHDGETREYTLHVPTGYDADTPTPLVFNFHGRGSQMSEQIFFSAMNPTADEHGFMVVYPQGLMNADGNRTWNAGLCCADDTSRDDVGFVRAILAELDDTTCIDHDRIFSTGMSNGGFMSYLLACEAADVFAAVAPVAGALGIPEASCEPGRTVPLIHFHGTDDSLVPVASARESADVWAAKNGCTGAGEVSFMNGDTTCTTWSSCADNGTVTYCESDAVGHCWPGQLFCPFGDSTEDIVANDEMWTFFEAHPMP